LDCPGGLSSAVRRGRAQIVQADKEISRIGIQTPSPWRVERFRDHYDQERKISTSRSIRSARRHLLFSRQGSGASTSHERYLITSCGNSSFKGTRIPLQTKAKGRAPKGQNGRAGPGAGGPNRPISAPFRGIAFDSTHPYAKKSSIMIAIILNSGGRPYVE
jgi:hypothetical protein